TPPSFSRRRSRESSPRGYQPLDLSGNVEVALGTQEETIPGTPGPTHQTNRLVEGRLRRTRREAEVAAPAFSLNPAAIARASTIVDFPLPFSPIRKVTLGWRITSFSRLWTAGKQ